MPAPSADTATAPIPNLFVCIGAQKAGTTWLAQMLGAHADIFVSPVKELHYFDHSAGITQHLEGRRRRSRFRKYVQRLATQPGRFAAHRAQFAWYRDYMRTTLDDAWYARLFAHRGAATFAGEATPEYALIGADGFAHLKRLAPDVKIIFVLRHPVRRAWSQLLHHCRREGLDAGRMPVSEMQRRVSQPEFHRFSDYLATLDALSGVFPPDQIGVFFYEDLHAERAASLAEVVTFIGADPSLLPSDRLADAVNVSQRVALPEAFERYLADRYADIATGVRVRLGALPDTWDATWAAGSHAVDPLPPAEEASGDG